MIKRIAVFSLNFDGCNGVTEEVSVRLPVEFREGNVFNACEALADKLGLYFCYTEDIPEETFD